ADGEPQAPQRDVIGHVGRAGGAEQDGVVALDQGEAVLGHERTRLLVALRAPVEMVEGDLEAAIPPGAGLQRLDAGRDHLLADAVSGDGGDAQLSHFGSPVPVAFADFRGSLRGNPRGSGRGIFSGMSTFRAYSDV